jgi:hypothetical protein
MATADMLKGVALFWTDSQIGWVKVLSSRLITTPDKIVKSSVKWQLIGHLVACSFTRISPRVCKTLSGKWRRI